MRRRDLPELREHPARAFGGRGKREQRLRRQAGGDRVRVQVRVPLPGPRLLQFEHPRLDVVGQHRLLGVLDVLQPRRVDLGQPAGKPRQGPEVGLDGRTAVVLEQVVMRVDPVEGSDSGTHLLQVAEVVVHEVWQRLGRIHGRQKSQWYNTSQPSHHARRVRSGRDSHRQPRGHDTARAAITPRSRSHRRRRHAAHRQVAHPLRDHDADGEPARAQRAVADSRAARPRAPGGSGSRL